MTPPTEPTGLREALLTLFDKHFDIGDYGSGSADPEGLADAVIALFASPGPEPVAGLDRLRMRHEVNAGFAKDDEPEPVVGLDVDATWEALRRDIEHSWKVGAFTGALNLAIEANRPLIEAAVERVQNAACQKLIAALSEASEPGEGHDWEAYKDAFPAGKNVSES